MIELQPTLTGALVTLRPLRADDWHELFAVASDPLIWEQHPAKGRYQESEFRAFFDAALATQSAFAVIDARSGKIIGSSRYHGFTAELREVEVGWTFLARSHWGGLYNREMKRLMLAHIFQFVDRVIFVVGTNNVRSQEAVQRLGAVLLESHASGGPGLMVYALADTSEPRAPT
jgi:N-acetyltransferase